MMKVSILGSGELGATIAQKLACSDWPGEIALIDTDAGAAKGRALDLLESNPVLRSGTRVRGTDRLDDIERSHYILVAEMGESISGGLSETGGKQILQAIEKAARDAVILVTTNDPTPFFRLVLKSATVDPRKVLGTSPEALASLWRQHIGRRLGCSPQDIQVSILGAPFRDGLYEVLAGIAGQAIERLLLPVEFRAIAASISARPHPGPRTLASAASKALKNMHLRTRPMCSGYAWVDGAYGAKNLFLSAPVILTPRGIERILEIQLEPRQAVTLSRSLDFLARALQ